ncbi:MAG: hypothetical protein RLZZ401_598 [Pseudomonadota bacterium]
MYDSLSVGHAAAVSGDCADSRETGLDRLPRLPAANGSNVLPLQRHLGDQAERSAQAPLHLYLMRMLDEVDYGLVLLDVKGHIWHANHLARAEMGRNQVLHTEGGRLCTRVPGKQLLLQQAIYRASQGTRSLVDLCLISADNPGLSIALVPMGHPAEAHGDALPVLAITSRQLMCEQISLHFFAQSYGLTGAEKSVLLALSQGHDAKAIAQQKVLALSTVRTQIKQLRVKTRSTSIRELLGKVATLPPVVSSIKAF